MNFAIGDWFPLGAVASRRYALLNRVPLLPHEELLCKEAMLLRTCLELEDSDFPSPDLFSHNSIKISFVNLMRFQHRARWFLTKSRAGISVSFHSHGTILCSLCKRDCYIAYVGCNCHKHHVCLRHGKLCSFLFTNMPLIIMTYELYIIFGCLMFVSSHAFLKCPVV